jgi:hypothetical protein
MAILTPSQLTSASNATYFDNTSGSITPTSVRSLNDNWISSSILVSQTASLNVLSASYAASASYAVTSSLPLLGIVTASVIASTVTFTKGDETTFDIVISQSGSVQTASYTLYAENAGTASIATSASYAVSSSQAANATLFNSLSSSQFAQLVANNTFTGNNIFGNITASSAQVTSASIEYLTVIYETASVIYSSGSNQFGDASNDIQTLYGTVDIKTGPLLVTGSARVTGSLTMAGLSPINVSHVKANDVQGVEILTNSSATVATFGAGGGTGVTVVGQVNAASFAGSGSGVIGVVTSSFARTSSLALTNIFTASVSNNTITFVEGDGTTFNLTVATGSGTNTISASFAATASSVNTLVQNVVITGSLITSGTFSVANATGIDFQVTNTGTLIGNAITDVHSTTGSFSITGSSTFSGSVNGQVISSSVASQTSSLNFETANFFTSAVTGSTFFNITNPKAGETVNVLLTTVGVSTASFSSNVRQVSGSAYTPTSGSGRNDVLTFISFDGSSVYLANVKNLV